MNGKLAAVFLVLAVCGFGTEAPAQDTRLAEQRALQRKLDNCIAECEAAKKPKQTAAACTKQCRTKLGCSEGRSKC